MLRRKPHWKISLFSATVFKNLYDNKTDKRIDLSEWNDFEDLLYKLSKRNLNSKKEAELISPAVFEPGTTRANRNVTEWAGWCAIDVDDHQFKGNLEQELKNRYGTLYFICYSTASSSINHPKFRLVFPLKRGVRSSKIRHFWFALNTELDSIGDRQTKDYSRMYYSPANYSGSHNFIFTNHGEWIDPHLMMDKHPYVEKTGNSFLDKLPPEMQKQIIEHRRGQLTNTDVQWSSYSDCPFVNKRLLQEYMSIANTDGTGRYRMIYKIMISIASNAIEKKYPITTNQIVELIKQIDRDSANRYENRPLDIEANNALQYAYKNVT